MAGNGDVLSDMIKSAVEDPRFGEIFSALKEKSERGELDISSLVGGAENESVREEAPQSDAGEKDSEKRNAGSGDVNIVKKLTDDFCRHRNLIAALRPYLSEGKRCAVDNLLKIGDMSSAIGTVIDLGSLGKENG